MRRVVVQQFVTLDGLAAPRPAVRRFAAGSLVPGAFPRFQTSQQKAAISGGFSIDASARYECA
jgi:hypothetical protein